MPLDFPARVVRHDRLDPEHFLLTLEAPRIAREARAGQFVMLETTDGCDPLLRRPMSLCRVQPGRRDRIQILYKVVGRGTARLSRQPRGAVLRTLGPLGNGFHLPARRRGPGSGTPLLVAGGIGVAIFPFLVESLRARGLRPALLFGARTRRDLVGLPFFRRLGVPVSLATEDGSAGTKGLVTGLLEARLARPDGGSVPELYVCGPTPMMRAVAQRARTAGAPCQLALESQMPCGIGVCLGCVVRSGAEGTGPPYVRVCTEGPVFEAGCVVP
jgi:dihydroorotate dehydrogenase electron transfer subunit